MAIQKRHVEEILLVVIAVQWNIIAKTSMKLFLVLTAKKNHPSYSRNCEKWIIEKEIQTIYTKQSISYLEAKKIVESQTPTIKVRYSTIASKQKNTKHKSIRVQTEYFENCKSQIINNEIQPQTSSENSNKPLGNETEKSNLQKPIVPKLPLYKKITENIIS